MKLSLSRYRLSSHPWGSFGLMSLATRNLPQLYHLTPSLPSRPQFQLSNGNLLPPPSPRPQLLLQNPRTRG